MGGISGPGLEFNAASVGRDDPGNGPSIAGLLAAEACGNSSWRGGGSSQNVVESLYFGGVRVSHHSHECGEGFREVISICGRPSRSKTSYWSKTGTETAQLV